MLSDLPKEKRVLNCGLHRRDTLRDPGAPTVHPARGGGSARGGRDPDRASSPPTYPRAKRAAWHRAFMEPGGRNQWQPIADAPAAKPQERATSVAAGCEPLPLNL
jgi:hypothetical protein